MTKNEHHGGPVDRLEWLGAIIDDDRARAPHIRIAKHIIARYYAKFGNARASVSFLQVATGYTRGTVASATADLESWGYYSRKMGAGTRPTEYYPDFSVLQRQDTNSVRSPQDAKSEPSVLGPQDSCVLPSSNTTQPSVLQRQDQTHLRNPFTNGVTYRNARAPHALGLSASAAGAGLVEVVSTEVESKDGETILHVHAADEAGQRHTISVTLESRAEDTQREGQRVLAKLGEIAGKEIHESEDLFGVKLFIDWDGDLLPPDDDTATRTAA